MKPLETARTGAKLGIELAKLPLQIAAGIGEYAMKLATEIYEGKPLDKSHIAEEIQSEIAVTDAEVGRGLVRVADDFAKKARAARKKGYSIISKAAIEAEQNPAADESVVRRIVDIAQETDTDPMRLDDTVLSKLERKQAQRIIHPKEM